MDLDSSLEYSIWNPTGNITALVESPVEISLQTQVGETLMRLYPEVEQVGFVDVSGPELRMAGGEFCGNASMCAAALCLARDAALYGEARDEACGEKESVVFLSVSGARQPVEVRVTPQKGGRFRTGIRMPAPLGIEKREFSSARMQGTLPAVRMEGITHIIIDPDSVFYSLQQEREQAETVVRSWCRQLNAEGLGLMFLGRTSGNGEPDSLSMRPLVYIPASGTLFWENSCASGSCAAAFYLACESGRSVNLTLQEPGGALNVLCDPESASLWLYGTCFRQK